MLISATPLHHPRGKVCFFDINIKNKLTGRRALGVNGIYNDGNTCFTNALIQALASSDHFVEWLQAVTTHMVNTKYQPADATTVNNLQQSQHDDDFLFQLNALITGLY